MSTMPTELNRMAGIDFIDTFHTVQAQAHRIAVDHGWWEGPERNQAEMIALMHSELSEALEGLRHGNPPSDHIPAFSAIEEEFADVIIRIMDNAERAGWHIAEASAQARRQSVLMIVMRKPHRRRA